MARTPSSRARAALFGTLTAACLAPLALGSAPAARAQQAGYGQTLGTSPLERQLYDYGPGKSGSGGNGSILDSTNPLDLMNKLKRSSALDNATPPSSAIDQALREFDAQTPKPGAAGGSSGKLQGI